MKFRAVHINKNNQFLVYGLWCKSVKETCEIPRLIYSYVKRVSEINDLTICLDDSKRDMPVRTRALDLFTLNAMSLCPSGAGWLLVKVHWWTPLRSTVC